jgi:dTDP-4-dehydrorhamnose reductase
MAIIAGLKARAIPVRAERVIPIKTSEFPTKAQRPLNSRLDLTRITRLLGHATPSWQSGLEAVLDAWPDINASRRPM